MEKSKSCPTTRHGLSMVVCVLCNPRIIYLGTDARSIYARRGASLLLGSLGRTSRSFNGSKRDLQLLLREGIYLVILMIPMIVTNKTNAGFQIADLFSFFFSLVNHEHDSPSIHMSWSYDVSISVACHGRISRIMPTSNLLLVCR